jgi:hypothetical protein
MAADDSEFENVKPIQEEEWACKIQDSIQSGYGPRIADKYEPFTKVPAPKSAVVTRWVVMAEFMLEDGDRVFRSLNSGLYSWEALGLIEEGKKRYAKE